MVILIDILRTVSSSNRDIPRSQSYPPAASCAPYIFIRGNAVRQVLAIRRLGLTLCLAIHTVTVAGHQADFLHHDPLMNISLGAQAEAQDCHRHLELKRKVYSALQESDEGELSIAMPKEVALKQSGHALSDTFLSEGIRSTDTF